MEYPPVVPEIIMEPIVRHRQTCRLCKSSKVLLALKLTDCPPVDAFVTKERLNQSQPVFPIDLYLCAECGHAQLLDVVSPDLLFGDYIYTTSSSPGLVAYFREYASHIVKRLSLPSGARALDIGSNDGTLLLFLKEHGLSVLGVDPAAVVAASASSRGIETLTNFFTSQTGKNLRRTRGTFELVTANNVFAHSDELGDMADGICEILAPNGVFVFEVSYILDMIQNMVFDFIYHEHLSHHALKPLQRFLLDHGLQLFDVERTPSKGGTIRCYAQRVGGPQIVSAALDRLIQIEEENKLFDLATYREWEHRINTAKCSLKTLLLGLKSSGKTIAGYGASATGTVLTYHFDLNQMMEFIVDDNPIRQGRYSPGDHIPILPSETLISHRPDYVVILAWRFADMILARNREYLETGGRFITPLPTPAIL
jgi:SAM-dependent methyltransferase